MFRCPHPRADWHLKTDSDLNRHPKAETNLRNHSVIADPRRNHMVPRPHDAFSTHSTFDIYSVSNPLAYNSNLETETTRRQIKNVHISRDPFSMSNLSSQLVHQSSGSSPHLLLDTAASTQYLKAASSAGSSQYLEAACSGANSQYLEDASSAVSPQHVEAACSGANSQYLKTACSAATSQFLEAASSAANSQYLEAIPFSKFKMEASRTQLQEEGSYCSRYKQEAMTIKASSARPRFLLKTNTKSKLPFGVKNSSEFLLEAENIPEFPLGADNSPEFPLKADDDHEFPRKADNRPNFPLETDNNPKFILEPDICSDFVLGVDNSPAIHHRAETSAHIKGIQVSTDGSPILLNCSKSPLPQVVETRTSKMNLTPTSDIDQLEYIEENTTTRDSQLLETQQLDCKEKKIKVN